MSRLPCWKIKEIFHLQHGGVIHWLIADYLRYVRQEHLLGSSNQSPQSLAWSQNLDLETHLPFGHFISEKWHPEKMTVFTPYLTLIWTDRVTYFSEERHTFHRFRLRRLFHSPEFHYKPLPPVNISLTSIGVLDMAGEDKTLDNGNFLKEQKYV